MDQVKGTIKGFPRFLTPHVRCIKILTLCQTWFSAFKVSVHLQGCLAYKQCSTSGLNCRNLNPYIKLKLIGLAIRLYQKFWKRKWIVEFFTTSKFERPYHLLHVTCQREFCFRSVNVFLRFRGQSAKNTCLGFAVFNFSERLHNIFEIALKNMEWSCKTRSWKKVFRNKKNSRTQFVDYK